MDSCSRLTDKTLGDAETAAQTQSVSAATTMKNALLNVPPLNIQLDTPETLQQSYLHQNPPSSR